MRRGAARRAPVALPLPAALSPSRPRGLVGAAAKERDADGRTAAEGRIPVPASGGAVLASTVAMVSITSVTLLRMSKMPLD